MSTLLALFWLLFQLRFSSIHVGLVIGQNKIVCMFVNSRPTKSFCADSTHFYFYFCTHFQKLKATFFYNIKVSLLVSWYCFICLWPITLMSFTNQKHLIISANSTQVLRLCLCKFLYWLLSYLMWNGECSSLPLKFFGKGSNNAK